MTTTLTERSRSEANPRLLGFTGARDSAPEEDFRQGYEAAMDDLKAKLEDELGTWGRDGGGYDSGVRAGLMIAIEYIEGV